jgi:hypothetical protein
MVESGVRAMSLQSLHQARYKVGVLSRAEEPDCLGCTVHDHGQDIAALLRR